MTASIRERIARIVDPEAFAELERFAAYVASETVPGHRRRLDALAKADAILALAPFAGGPAEPSARQSFLDLVAESVALGADDVTVRACRGVAEASIGLAGQAVRRELPERAAHEMMRMAFALAAPASDYRVDEYQGARLDPRPGLASELRMARLQYDPLPDGGRRMTVRLVYRDGARPPRHVSAISGPASGAMSAATASGRPYTIGEDQGPENRVDLVFAPPARGGVVDLRDLAEGFGARREASFAKMRRNEAFCAFLKRMGGGAAPVRIGDGTGKRG